MHVVDHEPDRQARATLAAAVTANRLTSAVRSAASFCFVNSYAMPLPFLHASDRKEHRQLPTVDAAPLCLTLHSLDSDHRQQAQLVRLVNPSVRTRVAELDDRA